MLAITHFAIFSPAEPGHEAEEGGNHEEHYALFTPTGLVITHFAIVSPAEPGHEAE